MKSKLLASAVGMVLLGTSALALADDGRGHDHGRSPAYHGHHGIGGYAHGAPHHWSRDPRPVHYARPRHWHGPGWHHPAWHAPYRHYGDAPRHYGDAPRHYGRYDDGVTIIFRGRID